MRARVNPIAERSKNWLCNAMLELLQKKPYHDITITELCDQAGLVRKTFYRHFLSKESVIVAVIDSMFEEFYTRIREQNIAPHELPLAYFTYWERHKHFLNMLIENQLFSLLNDHDVLYLKSMDDIIGSKHANLSEMEKEYLLTMMSGGLWSMLKKWIVRGCVESPEEMARMTLHFFI
ncbi:TetR family transcriptional regulator [Paenibacillaceae bacterium]|nr:TetR family transcriptional regulator [Paenibacillaceae bacterium]